MNKQSFLTATHYGVYRAEVADGEIQKLHYFEDDKDPSPIGLGIVDALNAPSRITAPAVRESWLRDGPGSNTHLRGKEPFVEVSWDKVEELVADEITRVRARYEPNAVYAGSYGWASAGRFHHAQSQLKRFLNCTGGFTSSAFTYSFAAAEAMVPHILGSFRKYLNSTTPWESIAASGELLVAFGGIPLKNGQIDSGGLGVHRQREGLMAAKDAGVEFINVSPIQSDMDAAVGAEWVALRPNSDVAMMLGLAHTLYSENLHKPEFLSRYCTGYEQFEAYLTGATDGVAKDADWAAPLCEVPAEDLRALARRMAQRRTMISVSWSLTRQAHGEQPYWMAITLAAMLGQIGLPGGGFGFGYSASNSIGAHFPLLSGGSFPQGKNPVSDFIPVARIADMLLNPGATFQFNGKDLVYPDIKLVWWAGGNPYHHHQDLNRLAKAWQKPETIIINDWCWTATAKRADIVLPCTTHVERNDVSLSMRDSYIIRMEKAVGAPKNVRDDYEIFRGITRRMNIEPVFSEGKNSDEWIRQIYSQTSFSDGAAGDLASNQLFKDSRPKQGLDLPDWDEFCERGIHQVPMPEEPKVMLADFIADPEANPLSTPSGKIEIYSETVAGFDYADCQGHPVWQTPDEWLGTAETDDLHLLSNQPSKKLHSQLDQGAISRTSKRDGREPVMLHPDDAEARGIADGDLIRLHNERGACLGVAVVSDGIRPGVIQMSTGAWWDPDEDGLCRHGNPNTLTKDQGTSKLGQGPTAHSCLVKIDVFDGEAPAVTAFEPPVILRT